MRSDSILSASASLLGVSLLIVTGVHLTGHAPRLLSDEVGLASALFLIGSSLAAHLAMGQASQRYDRIAANLFLLGLVTLLFAVVGFWF